MTEYIYLPCGVKIGSSASLNTQFNIVLQ